MIQTTIIYHISHYTTLPDRHEMTTLPGSSDVKGVAITTTTNRAYELIKHGGRLEDGYDLVSPPESPPGGYVNVVPSPPPPSSHQPLPPPPVAIPTPGNGAGAGEEAVYEPIPGDK